MKIFVLVSVMLSVSLGLMYWCLGRCHHQLTRPFTEDIPVAPPRGIKVSGTCVFRQYYVICLKCTQKFEYDLQRMRVGRKLNQYDRSSSRISGTGTNGLGRPLVKTKG